MEHDRNEQKIVLYYKPKEHDLSLKYLQTDVKFVNKPTINDHMNNVSSPDVYNSIYGGKISTICDHSLRLININECSKRLL